MTITSNAPKKTRYLKTAIVAITVLPAVMFAQMSLDVAHSRDSQHFMEQGSVTSGLNVDATITNRTTLTGKPITMRFFAHELPARTPILNLELENEKYMHVFGVRDDMTNFFHLYPNSDGDGVFTVDHTFTNPGVYKIWTSVRHKGMTHVIGNSKMIVSGGGDLKPKEKSFSQNSIVGDYQVALDIHDALRANQNNEVQFIVSDVFGRGVEIESFLGADMHLFAIKDDLKQFFHTHSSEVVEAESVSQSSTLHGIKIAEAHVEDNGLNKKTITFNIDFSTPGVYKLFAQFRPVNSDSPMNEGESLTADFFVKVADSESTNNVMHTEGDGHTDHEHDDATNATEANFVGDGHTDHTHAPVVKGPWYASQSWWVLFISSLILMTVLSFGVNAYVNPKKTVINNKT